MRMTVKSEGGFRSFSIFLCGCKQPNSSTIIQLLLLFAGAKVRFLRHSTKNSHPYFVYLTIKAGMH